MAIKPLSNEHELLVKISGGNERAFKSLFEGYYKPLGEFVLKLTNSAESAEEIVQDCFIKIWLRRETLPGIINFSSYIYIICRNQAFQVLKKKASERILQANLEKYLLEDAETDDENGLIEEYRNMIDKAVAKLPAQQLKVYTLSRYHKLKHHEIAKELDLSAETVKKYIQLAVQSIQKDVQGQINPGVVAILTGIILLN